MPAGLRSSKTTKTTIPASPPASDSIDYGALREPRFIPLRRSRPIALIAGLLLAAAVLAPWPFGSSSAFATGCWLCSLAVLAVVAVVSTDQTARGPIAAVASAGCAFIVLAVLQVVTPPRISQPFPLWAESADLLGGHSPSTIAAVSNLPLLALASPLLSVCAAICGIAIATAPAHIKRFLTVFAVIGTVYAAFALMWYAIATEYVLWWRKQSHVEDLTATFTNRNTAAVYIGITLIILCTNGAAQLDRHMSVRFRQHHAAQRFRRSLGVTTIQILICVIAIVLTNSRAGALLSLLCAAIAAALRLRRRYGHTWAHIAFVGATIVAFAFIGLILFGTRIASNGLEDGGRLPTYWATWQMANAYPWLGVGLGCFGHVFPMWRSGDAVMWGIWDRAHNSPLELAAETGLLFASLVIAGWIGVLVILFNSARLRRDTPTAVIAAVATLGLCHSLVDFSIQIPGFQIAFYAIVGAGIGLAFRNGGTVYLGVKGTVPL